MPKKVLICGAGAIGIYLGVMLNSKGHNVLLFGKRKLKNVGDEIFINNKIYGVPKKVFSLCCVFFSPSLYTVFGAARTTVIKKEQRSCSSPR